MGPSYVAVARSGKIFTKYLRMNGAGGGNRNIHAY